MRIDLAGKTALVTGSTSGIGHAIAKGLASAGAAVVINGRTQSKVDAAVAAITKTAPGTKAAGIAANVLHGGGLQHAGKRRCRQWTSSSIMPGSSVLSQASFKLYPNTRKP